MFSILCRRSQDCTASFHAFSRDCYTFVRSLPMLLLNKDTVVDILLDHLLMPNSTSLEALLDLTRCAMLLMG